MFYGDLVRYRAKWGGQSTVFKSEFLINRNYITYNTYSRNHKIISNFL